MADIQELAAHQYHQNIIPASLSLSKKIMFALDRTWSSLTEKNYQQLAQNCHIFKDINDHNPISSVHQLKLALPKILVLAL